MQGRIPEPVPAGLTVIETMRRTGDGRIALWDLHLERLRRDCAAVRYPLDEGQVISALDGVPTGSPLRVRLTVSADGEVSVVTQPLPAPLTEWTVTLSPVRLDSTNPWLRVKTSHRPDYEAARRSMPEGIDEVILLNERGELCDGTITSLFLQRGPDLLTPPVDCGLLPGVLRADLLRRGRATEAVLVPDDLTEGQILMGNALRGLIPCRLADG